MLALVRLGYILFPSQAIDRDSPLIFFEYKQLMYVLGTWFDDE